MKKQKRNTSGYRGVYYSKESYRKLRWYSKISVQYKKIHVGHFATAIEAARAYDEAAKKYHGKFANLNFSS